MYWLSVTGFELIQHYYLRVALLNICSPHRLRARYVAGSIAWHACIAWILWIRVRFQDRRWRMATCIVTEIDGHSTNCWLKSHPSSRGATEVLSSLSWANTKVWVRPARYIGGRSAKVALMRSERRYLQWKPQPRYIHLNHIYWPRGSVIPWHSQLIFASYPSSLSSFYCRLSQQPLSAAKEE